MLIAFRCCVCWLSLNWLFVCRLVFYVCQSISQSVCVWVFTFLVVSLFLCLCSAVSFAPENRHAPNCFLGPVYSWAYLRLMTRGMFDPVCVFWRQVPTLSGLVSFCGSVVCASSVTWAVGRRVHNVCTGALVKVNSVLSGKSMWLKLWMRLLFCKTQIPTSQQIQQHGVLVAHFGAHVVRLARLTQRTRQEGRS